MKNFIGTLLFGSQNETKGMIGEISTKFNLSFVNGYKKILSNCYIPKDDGTTTEIDIIMICETGIYVIESKNYSGWIFGSEDQKYWTQTLPHGNRKIIKNKFLNPIIQNKVHINWLKNYLKDFGDIPYFSYIVFSDRCYLRNLTLKTNQNCIINKCLLKKAIQRNMEYHNSYFNENQIDYLYSKLKPLSKVDKSVKDAHIEDIKNKVNSPINTFSNHIINNPTQIEALTSFNIINSNNTVNENSVPLSNSTQISNLENVEKAQNGTNMKFLQNTNISTIENLCPRCGGKLILRTAQKGKNKGNNFYGCSNFPKCRFIKGI